MQCAVTSGHGAISRGMEELFSADSGEVSGDDAFSVGNL